jgi:iron complex transport system substrate-binding protein
MQRLTWMHLPRLRRRFTALILVLAVSSVAAAQANAAAPTRVVALTPFSANTLAALGAKPVAIGQTLGGNERFDPRLRAAKMLPLSHPNGPNMEVMATLRPQLVFSSPTWRKGAQTMRRLGARVVEADPVRVHDLGAATRDIARQVGRAAAGQRLADRLAAEVRQATAGIRRRPRVLMVLGVGRTPFAFLPNSWGGDLVTRAGGRLVTAGAASRSGFARISDEKIVEEDPDVILAVPHGNTRDLPKIAAAMRSNALWKLTRAGRRGAIFVSMDNTLLQAGTDVGAVIRTVRQKYLQN